MRELTEETGLVPAALERVHYSYSFPMEGEWADMYAPGVEEIVEHAFVAVVAAQQEPVLSIEHDNWRWCTFESALQLLEYPGNIEALKRCNSYLKHRSRGE